MRPPSDVCWFRFARVTIAISTINHSYWSYKPHIVVLKHVFTTKQRTRRTIFEVFVRAPSSKGWHSSVSAAGGQAFKSLVGSRLVRKLVGMIFLFTIEIYRISDLIMVLVGN